MPKFSNIEDFSVHLSLMETMDVPRPCSVKEWAELRFLFENRKIGTTHLVLGKDAFHSLKSTSKILQALDELEPHNTLVSTGKFGSLFGAEVWTDYYSIKDPITVRDCYLLSIPDGFAVTKCIAVRFL